MSSQDDRAERRAAFARGGGDGAPLPPSPRGGATLVAGAKPPLHQSYWLWVMCLIGLNYFSTLAYQPSIAFEAAGLLAPPATVVLVALTLFGAVPVLRRVAKKSPLGLGSFGLIRRYFGGRIGMAFVMGFFGFAITDFIVAKTLSAADAAEHLIQNPFWAHGPAILQNQLFLTMALLVTISAFFLRRIRVVIAVAGVLVGVYLLLNLVIIASGLWRLATRPDLVAAWYENVLTGRWYLERAPVAGHGLISILLACLLLFPKLAIGLSGLEIGTAVMPLVRGDRDDDPKKPLGRIRETRKLLTVAALVMSFMLLGSAVVTTLLIQPNAMLSDGAAANRALAFIAHGETAVQISPLFGATFGTLYDISTVATLLFAGVSAMSVLFNLAPRYASSFGVNLHAANANWLLPLTWLGISLLVTWLLDANVQAQAGAYAVAVLVLICSDCLAVTLADWKRRRGAWHKKLSWRYVVIMLVFLYAAVAIVIEKQNVDLIPGAFVVLTIACLLVPYARSRTLNAGKSIS